MAETVTRSGAVLPVKVRTARTQHACDDCPVPIEPGDLYELAVYPPHSIQEWDSARWLTWRNHYPRHDGHNFLIGCALAAAYHEKAQREQLPAGHIWSWTCLLIPAGLLPVDDGPECQACRIQATREALAGRRDGSRG